MNRPAGYPQLGNYPSLYDHQMAVRRFEEDQNHQKVTEAARRKRTDPIGKQERLDLYLSEHGEQVLRFARGTPQYNVYGRKLSLPVKASGLMLPIHSKNKTKDLEVLSFHLKGLVSLEKLKTLESEFHENYEWSDQKWRQSQWDERTTKSKLMFSSALFDLSKKSPSKEKFFAAVEPSRDVRSGFYQAYVDSVNEYAAEDGYLYRLTLDHGPMWGENKGPLGLILRINYPTKVEEASAF